MKKLVLFDIDGTLLTPSKSHKESFNLAIMKVYGVRVDVSSLSLPGMTDRQIIFEALRCAGKDDHTILKGLKDCEYALLEFFAKLSTFEKLKTLKGVRYSLEALRREGVILGLATGNLEGIAKIKLGRAKIGSFFRVGGFGSDHYDRAEILRIALERARNLFGRINKAIVVGDTPRDVESAKRVNLPILGVATGKYSTRELLEAGADCAVNNLKEGLPFLLDR